MEHWEMWDFIAGGLLLLALWMQFYGMKLCEDSPKYNKKSLQNKVYGAMAISALYLICRFLGY